MNRHITRTGLIIVSMIGIPALAMAQSNDRDTKSPASPQEKTEQGAPVRGGANMPEAANPNVDPRSQADKQEKSSAGTGSATGTAGTATPQPVMPRNPADKQSSDQK